MCTGCLFYRPFSIEAVAETFMHLQALYAEKLLFLSKLHKKCPLYCSFRSYNLHIYDLFERYSHLLNHLTPNDRYSGRTAPLNSKVTFYIFIQQIQVLNILNMVYTLRFFPLQYAVCFIILTYLVTVIFTFFIQVC